MFIYLPVALLNLTLYNFFLIKIYKTRKYMPLIDYQILNKIFNR